MTSDQLVLAVGTRPAALLMILKSKLEAQRDLTVAMQTTDFDGSAPSIGPMGECPHCREQHPEGLLHG